MATPIAAPNLQRFALPEIDINYDNNGIISIIDDLVERVMSAHMKKSALQASASSSPEDDLVGLLSLHSVYHLPQDEEAAA